MTVQPRSIVPLCYQGEQQHGTPIPFPEGSIPVFRCDAATELMFAVLSREFWHVEEWCIRPPARACWIETVAPSAINSEGTIQPWGDKRASAWCALAIHLNQREAERIALDSEVTRHLPNRPQWADVASLMTMRIYVRWSTTDYGPRLYPTVNEYFFLDAHGTIVGDETDNFVLSVVDPWLVENMSIKTDDEAIDVVHTNRALRNALLYGLALLNEGAAPGTGKTQLLSALPQLR